MITFKDAEKSLKALADPAKAALQKTFFKTGKGQYGEGDRFLGVTVPQIRKLVPEFAGLSFPDIARLLGSPYNEVRLLALVVLVRRYEKGGAGDKKAVYDFYLKNLKGVNNWNLVDASAHYIVGDYSLENGADILYKLSKSQDLWEKRVAIVATFAHIRAKSYSNTLKISKMHLKNKHDLMHKACGWMLREVGKKDAAVLKAFLKEHHAAMPRTMLRYAIEKFPESERKGYLRRTVNCRN